MLFLSFVLQIIHKCYSYISRQSLPFTKWLQVSVFRCQADSELKIQCSSEGPQTSVASTKLGTSFSTNRSFSLSIALLFALCALPLPAANAATVTLGWDKNSELGIAGYRMHYGTTSGSYSYKVDVGNYTSCTISDLEEGTTYYFAATAYNTNNIESNLSEELIHTIPIPPSPPPPVDTDGDGISDNDETNTYGTDPNKSDTDNDGISDGEELSFWGSQWNTDNDGDGFIDFREDPDCSESYNEGGG